MYVLGINISHHCSICLLKDGDIVFYLEEERVSKIKKHDPRSFLNETRVYLRISDLNYFLNMKSILEISKFTKKIDCLIFSSYGHHTDLIIINIVKDQINNNFQIDKTYVYQEHHLYHACSAFYNSGFDRALSIVLDGGGFGNKADNESIFQELESIYSIDYNSIHSVSKHFSNYLDYGYYNKYKDTSDFVYEKKENFFSNSLSCGGIFNLISIIIGMCGEPGKTMGLAPYGSDKNVRESWFSLDRQTGLWVTDSKEIIRSFEQRFEVTGNLTMLLDNDDDKLKLDEKVAADLARKTQVETLEHTVRLIDKYTKLTGEKNVVLSGGYFLNCSNNYEYIKRFPDLNFFIDPIAHDGGTAIGAAKYLWHKLTGDTTIRRLETLYLG